VSSYEGLSFFAKGTGDVRVEFVIGAITEASGGGTCTEDCYDAHGQSIAITSEWKRFTLRFDELSQEGWGAEAAFSAADLLGINFKMVKPDEETPAEFDFWLDQVSFLKVGEGPTAEPEPEPEPPPEPSSEPGTCSPELKRYDGSGSVTYYTFAMGSSEVNCSYQILGNNPDRVAHIYTGEGRFFGAMNTTDYNNAAMCGACVEVTRDGGRKVVVTIVDQCPVATNPKCQAGHIDLSLEAFRQIGSDGEGHLGTGNGGATGNISWQYVQCPVGNQNVMYRLKEPEREDWNELLVQGHLFPIASVEIDGAQATRKAYNYWEPPGNMGKGPWIIKVTDIAGGVIESYVSRTEGELDAQTQFTCQ
jgi:expansin (peptidoglycan-binding protein)